MSMFTQKMRMLTAVVLDSDREKVVKALLEKGVMEFVRIDSLPEDKMKKLSAHASSVPRAVLTDMRVRIETLIKEGDIILPDIEEVDINDLPDLDMDASRRALDRLFGSLDTIRRQQKEINQKINSYREIIRYASDDKQYLDIRVGFTTHGDCKDLAERLETIGGVFLFSSLPYISLTLRRDSARVTDAMDKFGWTESTDPEEQKSAMDEAVGEAKNRISALENELLMLSEEGKKRIQDKSNELKTLWTNVRVHELCEHVESFFSYTKNTTLFSGWVPADDKEEISKLIYDATNGKCIVEWTEASEVEAGSVPVSITSPKILSPFRKMVDNYSTPEYDSINPTIFTTIAYLCMFALMFADLGQGFVLLLVGIIGTLNYKKHPMKKDGILSRYLCNLLLYLGPASMIGGLLFGSCFGLSIFPALWFNYEAVVAGEPLGGLVQTVYDILGITIKFGICVIYLGLLLNWINLTRKKRYFELIFDKNGLVGGVLYTIGIWFAFGFVESGYKTFPSAPWFMPILAICLALIVVKGPVGYILERKRGGEKESVSRVFIDTIMDFVVEALEIFSGFLSNTLSFMRVAGLGIAHASLMSAFYEMAQMPDNIVFAILIAIVGNVLVIVLEGLSAGIQSLRLNYYEFFTKYFTGHGIAFEPVGLKSKVAD